MATVDDLEAALLTAWTPENLQVYGDHLQGIGDPRGELISVDLHAEEHGASRDVAHRRRRAIRAWLELPVNAELRGLWAKTRLAFGFVEELAVDEIDRVLASPTAPYVRSVYLHGKLSAIRQAVEQLGAAPRPWLQRVVIRPRYQSEPQRAWTTEAPLIGEFAKLVRVAPNLEYLEVHGHRLIGAFTHPKLRAVHARGYDALRVLVDTGAALPGVTKLTLGLAALNELPPTVLDRKRIPTLAGFPGLRELDLSPNEAGYRPSPIHEFAFDLLLGCAPLEQLERVRVPQIRTERELAQMQKALDRMPALRELRILRARPPGSSLDHPNASIEIEPVAWPPLTSSKAIGYLDFTLPNTKPRYSIWISTEILRFADKQHLFGARLRASWAQLWTLVESLHDGESGELPMQTLLDMLDTLKLDPQTDHTWIALRQIARQGVPTDIVTITKRRR